MRGIIGLLLTGVISQSASTKLLDDVRNHFPCEYPAVEECLSIRADKLRHHLWCEKTLWLPREDVRAVEQIAKSYGVTL